MQALETQLGLHVAAMLVAFLQIFVRFSDVFRGFGTFWERLVGLYRFVDDLSGFGSILGQFWGPMLEPVWKSRRPVRKRKRPEIEKMVFFCRASNRDAVFETISRRFL